MRQRSGIVGLLLVVGFLALALATCIPWEGTAIEPVPWGTPGTSRGPGVGLLDATAIPAGIYAFDYDDFNGAGGTCAEAFDAALAQQPLAGGADTTNSVGIQELAVCNMCTGALALDFAFTGHATGSDYELSGSAGAFSAVVVETGPWCTYDESIFDMDDAADVNVADGASVYMLVSSRSETFEDCTGSSWHTYAIGIGSDPTAEPTAGAGACNLGSTLTPTATITPTITSTPTPLPTYTSGPTHTPTPTATYTTIPATATAAAATAAAQVALTATSAALTATPTATGTATRTRTPWPTVTPEFTPSATPTATSTPNWAAQNCPELAVTVDGSLAEWSAVTPIALNVGTAAQVVIAPAARATWTLVPSATPKTGAGTPTVTPRPTSTPAPTLTPAPAVADFAGLLYCAHDGAGTLYLAGTLTDSDIHNPVGVLINGDAAEASLDMYADNFRQAARDDHVITIAPNARTADFAIYPLGATAATGSAAGLWRFEIAIPATTHGRAGLDTGDKLGATWGYYDNRGGASWAYRLSAAKRLLVLQ